MPLTQVSSKLRTQGIFYFLFVALLIFQGAAAGFFIHVLGPFLGFRHFGAIVFAWVMFVLGGCLLGGLCINKTKVGETFKDPVLWFCTWLMRKGWFGYLLVAAVFGGPIGTATVLKCENRPRKGLLTVWAAVLFATLWVPLFAWVWKSA